MDESWKDLAVNCDKILAKSGAFSTEGNDGELQRLFEERLRRPMGSPMITRYGCGAEAILEKEQEFNPFPDREYYNNSPSDPHRSAEKVRESAGFIGKYFCNGAATSNFCR